MSFKNLFEKSEYSVAVSTDILRDMAVSIKGLCLDIEHRFSNIEKYINDSSYCWTGRGADLMHEFHSADKSEIENAVADLKKQIANLDAVIFAYEGVENALENDADTLPFEILK